MKKIFVLILTCLFLFGALLNAQTQKELLTDIQFREEAGNTVESAQDHRYIRPNTEPVTLSTLNRDPDYQVYGFNCEGIPGYPQGVVTFTLDNPSEVTSIGATSFEYWLSGLCYVEPDSTYYGVYFEGGLYTVDITTGETTYLFSTWEMFKGIEYDDASETLYATSGSRLYIIDRIAGGTTLVGYHEIPNPICGIAGDGLGNMYGYNLTSTGISILYSIDLETGLATPIGSTGFKLGCAQDIAFDKDAGVLYSAAYFWAHQSPSGLYTIDTETAQMTLIDNFPWPAGSEYPMELSGLAIPYSHVDTGAPNVSTDVSVISDTAGALSCDISWTCPTLDLANEPLTELLEMRVYRDDILVYTDDAPTIGEPGNYTDNPTTSGIYEYTVVGYNTVGEGRPVTTETWVGSDVPDVVENLQLEQTTPGVLSATLTWENSTTGLHGGAFVDSILGYRIIRNSSVLIEIDGLRTTYVDTDIDSSGNYSYSVQAHNAVGYGGIALSDWVLITGDSDLLIDEHFDNGVPPGEWYAEGEWQNYWIWMLYTSHAGGTPPEMLFYEDYKDGGRFKGLSRMCTMPVNTVGMNELQLQFNHKIINNNGGYTVGVATSSDGTNWNTVWDMEVTTDIPARTEVIDITTSDVGSSTFQACLFFDGDITRLGKWYIDDFILTDAPQGVNNDNEPSMFTLKDNFPDPFTSSSRIQFSLKKESHVSIDIYNIIGQKIKTLVDDFLYPGDHETVWNGDDENNKPVANGIYFYKMNSEQYSSIKKMVLMR